MGGRTHPVIQPSVSVLLLLQLLGLSSLVFVFLLFRLTMLPFVLDLASCSILNALCSALVLSLQILFLFPLTVSAASCSPESSGSPLPPVTSLSIHEISLSCWTPLSGASFITFSLSQSSPPFPDATIAGFIYNNRHKNPHLVLFNTFKFLRADFSVLRHTGDFHKSELILQLMQQAKY